MTDQAIAAHTRPRPPLAAAVLQLLTAVPFLLSIVVVWVYGTGAQAAAEAELVRQGVPAAVLAEHGISFGANTAEIPIPAAIIAVLVAFALLNFAGKRAGRILSWLFHPVLAVAGILIVPAQLFTASYLQASFRDDPVLARIDVPALVTAAQHAMPAWLPAVDWAKLLLTTLGSVAVIVLLALRRTGRSGQDGVNEPLGRRQ